jgi:hypothetical protein
LKLDTEYLRQHYESLSDEALEEIDRNDLVDVAQTIYDQEVGKRKRASGSSFAMPQPRTRGNEVGSDDEPDWAEDGAEVFSAYAGPGTQDAPRLEAARLALEAEGIPCVTDTREEPEHVVRAMSSWVLKVPSAASLRASSVLDREIFNSEFEEGWRHHLAMLSDEEVLASPPHTVFPGLYDQIDRANRAYREELSQRGLQPKP